MSCRNPPCRWRFCRRRATVPPQFTGFILFEVGENQTTVATVEAIDPDGDAVSYAITGGADQERFQIGATSGVLSFTTAPDFENPADADGDNRYVVIVTATGGTGDRALMVDRTIYVTVNDAAEDFCGRTEQVQDAILAKLGETNCGNVGSEELASITGILDVSNTEITSLKFGDFSGLTALRGLNLSDNLYLNSLPHGVFSGLTALATLELSDTGLSSLPAGIFSGLTALEALDLGGNTELSSLPAGVFSGLTALATLDLNDSGLSSLPAGVFAGLTALQRLNLTNNPLSSLNADLFSGLTALATLDLSFTGLSSLPAGIFSGLTALEALDLGGNPVNPLPIPVSLRNVGDSRFKAIAPTRRALRAGAAGHGHERHDRGRGDDGDDSGRGRGERGGDRRAHERDDRGRHCRYRHPAEAARRPPGLYPAESRRPAAGGGNSQRRAGVYECRVVFVERERDNRRYGGGYGCRCR